MPQLGDVLNVRGFKLLILALLTAAAAALTLSTSAQTPGGSDPQETARGRIIARIHDTTGEDGVDDYRVEFGFFPEWESVAKLQILPRFGGSSATRPDKGMV